MGRKYGHDYKSPCIYHITLKKAEGVPAFGVLAGTPDSPSIRRSRLGNLIARRIYGMSAYHGNLRILQYMVMPDHVHFLLQVTAPIPYHLGNYISRLKVEIGSDNIFIAGFHSTIFEEDYYDCILHPGRSLDTLYQYIRDNPRRLAVRRAFPDYFRRVNELTVCGVRVQAYGNFQLLENPFKEQVVVHRADTPEERAWNRERWLYTAANRGVLVSPFISPAEKGIRAEAEALGGRFILITAEPFGERYKPAAHNFALCEAGNLLIISAPAKDLTRQQCLAMNRLAGQIARAVPPFGNNR